MIRRCAAITAVLVVSNGLPLHAQTIQLSLNGQTIEGRPLYWDTGFVALLARDGQIWQFRPSEASDAKQVSNSFRGYSQAKVRGILHKEFGSGFEVSGTGQYLVVHPSGQRDLWARRFEELYRATFQYFNTRGVRTSRPEFPFVAIVFPTRHAFLRYARQQRLQGVDSSVQGVYLESTNRIYLFDESAGTGNADDWYVNSATIIHEAAHQTCFNIGIHRRYGSTPAWVIEGIGTMFESRGIWDSRHNGSSQDRIHSQQLATYRKLVTPQNSMAVLQQQVASDRLFESNFRLAYAHAWALTFYLAERDPRNYARYLRKTYDHEAFAPISAAERLKDFVSVFGSDFRLLDARLQRFVESL